MVASIAPKEHKGIATAEQRQKGDKIEVEDTEEAMTDYWQNLYGQDVEEEDKLNLFEENAMNAKKRDTRHLSAQIKIWMMKDQNIKAEEIKIAKENVTIVENLDTR